MRHDFPKSRYAPGAALQLAEQALASKDYEAAERWLADLQTLLGSETTALYPQRESLGAEEPHYELAGERIETIDALLHGAVRE